MIDRLRTLSGLSMLFWFISLSNWLEMLKDKTPHANLIGIITLLLGCAGVATCTALLCVKEYRNGPMLFWTGAIPLSAATLIFGAIAAF
jgi:hypothetical protein